MMLDQTSNLPEKAGELLGDLTALVEQLGGAQAVGQLPAAVASLECDRIDSLPALRNFLQAYTARILIPHELPAIARAYGHAARYEVRELIQLDRDLERAAAERGFPEASRRVGAAQLRKLRPLRGERLVQRYLAAFEAGDAYAWHTLVFGLVLALYSLPLRQGLLHFSEQTLGGFVNAASQHLHLGVAARQELLAPHLLTVLGAIEALMTPPAKS